MKKMLTMLSFIEIKEQFPALGKKWDKTRSRCNYISFVEEKITLFKKKLNKNKVSQIDEIRLSSEFDMIKSFIKNPEKVSLDYILLCSDTGDIIKIFTKYSQEMDDKTYWRELRSAYQLQDYTSINFKLLKSLFSSDRKDKIQLMTKDEIAQLKTMGAEITIYRGGTEREEKLNDYGISWTLSKEKAQFFVDRQNMQGRKGKLFEKTIAKTEIVAYFSDRDEEEILYWTK